MKKILTILVLGSAMLCMVSCGAKQSGNKPEDTNSNDSIQGTFFGASFGASKNEVVKAFAAHDAFVDEDTSSEEKLSFVPFEISPFFSFEGMKWEGIQAYLINGRFLYILFFNPYKTKAAAIMQGLYILKQVSQKYNLTKEEPIGTNFFINFVGRSKDFNREVKVVSFIEKSDDNTIVYYAGLAYIDQGIHAFEEL